MRILQDPNQIRVQIGSPQGRFKHVSYTVLTHDRLAIDLWKSAPPSKAVVVADVGRWVTESMLELDLETDPKLVNVETRRGPVNADSLADAASILRGEALTLLQELIKELGISKVSRMWSSCG